jgi:hypothetical protein
MILSRAFRFENAISIPKHRKARNQTETTMAHKRKRDSSHRVKLSKYRQCSRGLENLQTLSDLLRTAS